MAFAGFCRESQPASFEPLDENLEQLTRDLAEVTGQIDKLGVCHKAENANVQKLNWPRGL